MTHDEIIYQLELTLLDRFIDAGLIGSLNTYETQIRAREVAERWLMDAGPFVNLDALEFDGNTIDARITYIPNAPITMINTRGIASLNLQYVESKHSIEDGPVTYK